jgi:hypothetical protein
MLPEIIRDTWVNTMQGNDLGNIADTLRNVMDKLKKWSWENFGTVTREITSLRTQIEALN